MRESKRVREIERRSEGLGKRSEGGEEVRESKRVRESERRR